ncbi:MAG: hypothetical protein R2942_06155 [Ignavibacteria bacterium]
MPLWKYLFCSSDRELKSNAIPAPIPALLNSSLSGISAAAVPVVGQN